MFIRRQEKEEIHKPLNERKYDKGLQHQQEKANKNNKTLARELNCHVPEEDMPKTKNTGNRVHLHCWVERMGVKITMRYHGVCPERIKLKPPDNAKCWQGCRATRHSNSAGKSVIFHNQYLQKINMHKHTQSNALWDMYPTEPYTHTHTHTEVLCRWGRQHHTREPNLERIPPCPSTVGKLWCNNTVEDSTSIKMNKLFVNKTTWKNPTNIILSEKK